MKVIQISDEVYDKLKSYIVDPFEDTPEFVIRRLMEIADKARNMWSSWDPPVEGAPVGSPPVEDGWAEDAPVEDAWAEDSAKQTASQLETAGWANPVRAFLLKHRARPAIANRCAGCRGPVACACAAAGQPHLYNHLRLLQRVRCHI